MFNLTYQERCVVLFIVAAGLVSLGFDFCRKRYPPLLKISYAQKESLAKVNINTADKEALMSLKGIGETLAQRIIDYREQLGSFATQEELKEVRGINDYRYEKLKEFITVQ